MVMDVCLRRFCLNMKVLGDIVCSELGAGLGIVMCASCCHTP